MPNWCVNEVTFSGGDEEAIKKFVENGENKFDFNKVVPRPASEEDNWYYWNIENWDTKWNSSDAFCITQGWVFETAWSPSLKVTQELSRIFRDVEFYHSYYESGVGFTGEDVYLNGEIISRVEYCADDDAYFDFLFSRGFEERINYKRVNGVWKWDDGEGIVLDNGEVVNF